MDIARKIMFLCFDFAYRHTGAGSGRFTERNWFKIFKHAGDVKFAFQVSKICGLGLMPHGEAQHRFV